MNLYTAMCIMTDMKKLKKQTNKNCTELISVAEYLFKQIRSEGAFLHIGDIRSHEDSCTFYGCFQGKKKRFYKTITLDKRGNVIKG